MHTTWYHMQPVHLFFLTRVDGSKKWWKSCVFHLTCYSQSSFLALLYITISNVTGVLQYTRFTALCNTSVIFLAVQKNYLQGHACPRFWHYHNENVSSCANAVTFRILCDLLRLVYTTSACGAIVCATWRKLAVSIKTIVHRVWFTN